MALQNDIFGYKRNAKPTGVFSTENSKLIFGGTDVAGEAYLVQNWSVNYAQQVQELFEIGSNALYWAKGRPRGQGALGRVIGAKGSAKFFPSSAYDICDGGATLKLQAAGGSCDGTGTNVDEALDKKVNLIMSGVVVTQLGFSMQVADVRLIENFGFRFGYLQLDE